MATLLSLNNLSTNEHQVYVAADSSTKSFAYSDGEETERYLDEVFSEEADLSVASASLQRRIVDWPTEYHLSSARANLLRPYNFSSVGKVLELGSGCGAMSRYLGELGLEVDAIEGSAVRARLGRMRCQDLDNVRVVNANYNDLSFPEGHYDLVLFVGVIEYAHKFHPNAASDRDAAIQILREARRLLAPGGVVLVAIENRLGLKYMLGAHEDHYGKRFVGTDGYQRSAGIATYSRPEWKALSADAGFAALAFSYPFPDYKLPRVVLSDQYISANPAASNHLDGMLSRDYHAPTTRSVTETMCWQAAASGGFLGDVANSFCLLLGDDPARLNAIQDFDFCHGAGSGRRPQFAVVTRKQAGATVVTKTPLIDAADSDNEVSTENNAIVQELSAQPYFPGQLLSARWLRDIVIYARRDEFEEDLRAYYAFLVDAADQGTLQIDLLPINIIVDAQGAWRVFDQEWRVDWPLTPAFVLFRALLHFIVNNWIYLREFLKWLELQTVRDFVEFGFHTNMIHLSEGLDEFIEQETRFQRAISSDLAMTDVQGLLDTVFDFAGEGVAGTHGDIYPQLFWRDADQGFSDARSASLAISPDPAPTTLVFEVASEGTLAALRLNPFDIRKPDDVGFFKIHGLKLRLDDVSRQETLWVLDDAEEVAAACNATSAARVAVDKGIDTWFATSDFPKLDFELEPPIELEPGRRYLVEVRLAVTRSIEYPLAYKHYLVRAADGGKRAERAEMNLTAMKAVSDHSRLKLEGEVALAQGDARSHLEELEAIKNSRPFRIGSRIVRISDRLRRLIQRGNAG